MKPLVTEFQALPINKIAHYLRTPFSKFDWVRRSPNGSPVITIPITVLPNALELLFPLGIGRARQTVQLTHSLGPPGGKRPWFICPTCPRRVGVLYHKNGFPFRCRKC